MDEPIQTDPSYSSSDEDTETQYHMSDRDLTNDHDDCRLNQVLIHPNDPTDAVHVTTPNLDVDMPTLLHSATTDSQQDQNIRNVFSVSDDIFMQSKPHPIENKQLPLKFSPDSHRFCDTRATQLFKPYELLNTLPPCNDPEQRQINAIALELKQLALPAHSEELKQTTAGLVCGITYEQVLEEATAHYLKKMAKVGETVRGRHSKRHAFITGLQSGVIAFILQGLSQAAACDGIVHSINNGSITQENLLPFFQVQRKVDS